jgi:transposase
MTANHCQHCGTDVSAQRQWACEAYDHIEIPPIEPVITRITLHGGVCPCCAKTFKAAPPSDMRPGSPFGENLRALVIYLRSTQGISFERLAQLLSDLFGLDISEGALVNMLEAAREAFFRADEPDLRKAFVRYRFMFGRDRPAGWQDELVVVGVPP